MIFEFIISVLLGFGLHQTRRVVETMPTVGWESISSYSIGGTAILLVFWPFWYWRLNKAEGGFIRGWLSLVMSLLSFGGGVVAGWLMDD